MLLPQAQFSCLFDKSVLIRELCGCAAAEPAKCQQQQHHRYLAELVEPTGTGQAVVHVALACAMLTTEFPWGMSVSA